MRKVILDVDTGTDDAIAKQGIQICEKYGDSRGDETESSDR